MTPQSDFLVLGTVRDGAVEDLRAQLAADTAPGQPGMWRPGPGFVFADIATLHNIRLVIVEDFTLADRRVHPADWPEEPVYLALLGCCDGPADALLAALAATCPGLRAVFGHCAGFGEGDDLLAWMQRHARGSAASYVNGPGRTVAQVHEERALAELLHAKVARLPRADAVANAAALKRAVHGHGITLTPEAAVVAGWRLRNAAHFMALPLGVLALAWLTVKLWWLVLPLLALAAWYLRRLETRDPVIRIRPDPAEIARRSAYEDHDVTNPFSAVGSLKPGRFRLGVARVVLWVIDWFARHIYRQGRLGRVGTIHFARWVLIDRGRRVLFTSEYDGTAEAYMDDFINKVWFGLNAVFSNGIGYPRTRWLAFEGAADEQGFKAYMRHHQIVTQLWWRAYPRLTTFDLARHHRLRRGFESGPMTPIAAQAWLAEIG